MKAEQVLTVDYSWSDGPLEVGEVDGLLEAVETVAETKEAVFVECEERVSDYKVYYNTKTETIRIGAIPMCASYEVAQEELEKPRLNDYE